MHRLNPRRLSNGIAVGGAAVLLLCVTAITVAAEVPLDQLPAAVTKAADEVAPKTTWHSAFQAKNETGVTYELNGESEQGKDVNLVLTADGKVTAVELEIALKEVPQPVRMAVMKRMPQFKPATAFTIRRGTDLARTEPAAQIVAVDGTVEEEREASIEVTPEGKITTLELEIDIAKVPATIISAVKKKAPGFAVSVAYELSEGEAVTRYLLEGIRSGTTKGEVEVSIYISADGKEIRVE